MASDDCAPIRPSSIRPRADRRRAARSRGALWLGVIWIALQLLVPLARLAGPEKPAPFGWQMYSRALAPYEFDVVMPDGERRSVALDSYVTVPREEIPWDELLWETLCSGMPDGTVVEARRGARKSERVCS